MPSIVARLDRALQEAVAPPLELHPDTGTADTLGHHLVCEFMGCPFSALNNLADIETMMQEAAKAAGMTIVKSEFKHFRPQGVSGVVIVEESHLSIHTWPEKGYAAVDLYTCGTSNVRAAFARMEAHLKPATVAHLFLARGLIDKPQAIEVLEDTTGAVGAG